MRYAHTVNKSFWQSDICQLGINIVIPWNLQWLIIYSKTATGNRIDVNISIVICSGVMRCVIKIDCFCFSAFQIKGIQRVFIVFYKPVNHFFIITSDIVFCRNVQLFIIFNFTGISVSAETNYFFFSFIKAVYIRLLVIPDAVSISCERNSTVQFIIIQKFLSVVVNTYRAFCKFQLFVLRH